LTIYGKFFFSFAVFILAGFSEWALWTEKKEETFRHIGQWGSLVAVGLVFAAIIVDHLVSKSEDDQGLKQPSLLGIAIHG
jgi:uncharacterized membrane protein